MEGDSGSFRPQHKPNRWYKWNYSDFGFYFVTICTNDRIEYFGEIIDGQMRLNENGKIIEEQWEWLGRQYPYIGLDEFVIMPNHVHSILLINSEYNCKSNIVSKIVGTGRDLSAQNESIPTSESIPTREPTPTRTGHDLSLRDKTQDKTPIKIKSLSELIGAFKMTTSKKIHLSGPYDFSWQRSFYDHIVRTETELHRIREYIVKNPFNWFNDRNNQNENLFY